MKKKEKLRKIRSRRKFQENENIFRINYEEKKNVLTLSTGIDGHALHKFQNDPIIRISFNCYTRNLKM